MSQAALRTDRLELVPLFEDHLAFLVDLNSDPVVHRFLFHRGLTAEETEQRLRRALAAAAEADGLGQWIGSSDGEPIGLWMLQPPHGPSQPRVPGEADLGYRLPQRYWRQGYAAEGARELVRHGFEDLGLTRIFAQTMAVNQPSRATMAAVGLKFVRTFAEEYDVPIPGQEQGEVEYDITRERWLAEFGGRHLHDPDPTYTQSGRLTCTPPFATAHAGHQGASIRRGSLNALRSVATSSDAAAVQPLWMSTPRSAPSWDEMML